MLNYKSLNAVTLVGRIGSLDMRSSASGSKFLTCSVVNFQRFPTLDAKKLVNAPKMSAHHRGICHF